MMLIYKSEPDIYFKIFTIYSRGTEKRKKKEKRFLHEDHAVREERERKSVKGDREMYTVPLTRNPELNIPLWGNVLFGSLPVLFQ
jgi:hypothetical protein